MATATAHDVPALDPTDVRPPPRSILRDLLILAAIGAGLWMVYRLGRVFAALILATFFAYVIAPLVDRAETRLFIAGKTRRLPRAGAIALVYLLLAGVLGIVAAILWPMAARQLDAAIASGPGYAESFRVWEHGWTRYYERLRIPIELRHGLDQSVLGATDAVGLYARGALATLIVVIADLPWLVLIPVFAFFLLRDATEIRRMILLAVPHRVRLRGHRLFEALNATLAAYVRAQVLASVVVGSLCGLGFALLGNPYAILLGVLAALLECIPLVGPFVVAVIAVGLAALLDPVMAVWTAVFLAVVRVVEDYVIYPRLIGRSIHLHPLVIILAVLAGFELGGIAGIFIAVPVVALATVVGRHLLGWREEDAAAVS